MRFAGKVALVTGCGRGLGRVIGLRLGQEGAALVAHYASSRTGADEVVETIEKMGGRAIAYQADISKRVDVQRLFKSIDKTFGRLDIVVNSAGITGHSPLAELDHELFEEILGVNLRGPLYVASEAAKRLQEGGRIINISSSAAQFPFPGDGVYSATKKAVKSFTECWAKELGAKGITVNTVTPGATSPGMMEHTDKRWLSLYEQASPFGRIGRAEEVAAVVAFLASPEASWVSGARILANGAGNM